MQEEEEEEEDLPDYIKNDKNYDRKYGDKYETSVKDSEVSDKDREVLEKIRLRERKIQNMQEEIQKIYMKEGKQGSGVKSAYP